MSLSKKRDKRNEENLTELVQMVRDKPPDTKHVIESDQELPEEEQTQEELLRLHHSLGHFTFRKINILYLLGIITKRIAIEKTTKYEGCIYGAMTKLPWRTKGRHTNVTQTMTTPGDKFRVRLARMWLLDNCWLPGDIPSTKMIAVTSRVQILVVTLFFGLR